MVDGYDQPQRVCATCKNKMKNIQEVGNKRPRKRRVCILGSAESGRSTLYRRALNLQTDKSSKYGRFGRPTATPQASNNTSSRVPAASQTSSPAPPSAAVVVNSSPTLSREYRGSSYEFSFINTALEQGSILQPHFTIGTDVFLILYSVTDRDSFEAVERVRDRILDCGALRIIIVVANKADVDPAMRRVSKEEGLSFAREWGVEYREMSALSARDVESLLTDIVRAVGEVDNA